MTMFAPPPSPSVAACIADARTAAGDEVFLSQSQCVDALLDAYNAAVRPCVRDAVSDALAAMSHVRLVRASEYLTALDTIQMALQVDAAFDHLELTTPSD